MSENAGIDPVVEPAEAEPVVDSGQQNSGGGDNPAWQPFLEVLPDSLHELVKPVLKEWDTGINGRFQEIHQQYAPYKSFLDEGIDAESLTQAYQLRLALENDPEALYKQLGQYYGYATGGQGSPAEPTPNVPAATPGIPQGIDFGSPEANAAWQAQQEQFIQQQAVIETMGQLLLSGRQETEHAQADNELDSQLNAAKEAHGDFSEPYVLSLVSQGFSVDEAVQEFHSAVSAAAASSRPAAPTVLGGAGGAMPTESIDPGKMTTKETKDFIVQKLMHAHGQT